MLPRWSKLTSLLHHLVHDATNVPAVVNARVMPALQLHTQPVQHAQHALGLLLLLAIEPLIHALDVAPLTQVTTDGDIGIICFRRCFELELMGQHGLQVPVTTRHHEHVMLRWFTPVQMTPQPFRMFSNHLVERHTVVHHLLCDARLLYTIVVQCGNASRSHVSLELVHLFQFVHNSSGRSVAVAVPVPVTVITSIESCSCCSCNCYKSIEHRGELNNLHVIVLFIVWILLEHCFKVQDAQVLVCHLYYACRLSMIVLYCVFVVVRDTCVVRIEGAGMRSFESKFRHGSWPAKFQTFNLIFEHRQAADKRTTVVRLFELRKEIVL